MNTLSWEEFKQAVVRIGKEGYSIVDGIDEFYGLVFCRYDNEEDGLSISNEYHDFVAYKKYNETVTWDRHGIHVRIIDLCIADITDEGDLEAFDINFAKLEHLNLEEALQGTRPIPDEEIVL